MANWLRDAAGAVLVLTSISVLFVAVTSLRGRDYLACSILVLTGLSVMRAGVELLRSVSD